MAMPITIMPGVTHWPAWLDRSAQETLVGDLRAVVKQAPLFTPRAARPIGNPASWVSTNDYPARDLREGNQGTTGFALTVGTDGRVVACQVARSSGFPGLDKATCDALSRRARFTPASDANGAKVTGRYASSIRWVIPD